MRRCNVKSRRSTRHKESVGNRPAVGVAGVETDVFDVRHEGRKRIVFGGQRGRSGVRG
jgi:hypothetical protein